MTPEEVLEYVKELRRADQEQLKVAREALDKRIESMNEIRGQLRDQTAQFVTRQEHKATTSEIDQRLRGVEKLVWMGVGGIAIIQIVLHYMK